MKIQSVNPVSMEVLAEFELASKQSIELTVAACASAQHAWGQKPIVERAKGVAQLAGVLRKNSEKYAQLMTLEMGKPITQARAEIEKCATMCEYYAANGETFLTPEKIEGTPHTTYVRFDPLGIILGIMPWNFPFWQVLRFSIPSLIAGNGVLLKHASNVPQCAIACQEMYEEAGLPKGLFTTLLLDGASASELVKDPRVSAVSLTGSTQAGSRVAAVAGAHLKKCVLELGGSDPFIVLADADIQKTVTGAITSRLINGGQSCISAKRFIIEKPIAQSFIEALTEEFKKLSVGDPLDEKTTIGPLAKREFAEQIHAQVEASIKAGAHVVVGGVLPPAPSPYYPPTLLENVREDMTVWQEEVFGPVLSYIVVENVEEAIAMANRCQYGLAGSVWSEDRQKAEAVAARIESGLISINDFSKSDARYPMGGVKLSGFGRELGKWGIREFVNAKTVVVA